MSKKSILLGRGALGEGLFPWSSAASRACAWGAPSAALGAAFPGRVRRSPAMKLRGWPVLPPCPRHDRGPALLAAQPKRGGQRAPTATPLFSSPSNPFFVRAWNILLQEGSCSSLFLGVFSPSRPPGRFGNYRKSTRLLPLVKDNGCECVRHELQGQPRQRVIV